MRVPTVVLFIAIVNGWLSLAASAQDVDDVDITKVQRPTISIASDHDNLSKPMVGDSLNYFIEIANVPNIRGYKITLNYPAELLADGVTGSTPDRENNTNNFDTFLPQSGGNAFLFDGKRSGFFLGIEIGAGMSTWTSKRYIVDWYDDEGYTVETNYLTPSFITNFKIGYGYSDQTLFYVKGGLSTSGVITFSSAAFFDSRELFVDLKGGLGFMHFLAEDARFYYHGSLGYVVSAWWRNVPDGSLYESDPAIAPGVSGGIGYELFSNLNLEVTLDYYRWDAEPSDIWAASRGNRYNVITFSITLSPHLY